MFFDIHCHILPAVDDGARSGDSTRRMMMIASQEGIESIVATPHYACGMSEKRKEEILEIYKEVRAWWKEFSPSGELYLGSELFWSESLLQDLKAGKAMTMNGTSYILLEFPTYINYSAMFRAFQTLVYAGYRPILAHVERYVCLRQKGRVGELVDQGVYIQANVSAVLGRQGLRTKWFLKKLLKAELIHFIGTDAHNSKDRCPEMLKCKDYLDRKIGRINREQILEKNPAKMLKGEIVNE